MKFYKNNFYFKIIDNKLTAVYSDFYKVVFYKNGLRHNSKNAAFIKYNNCKGFSLNGKFYGNNANFNKESWRKFAKLQAFL